VAQRGLANILEKAGRSQMALRAYDEGIAAGRQLIRADPDNKELRGLVGGVYSGAMHVLDTAGDLQCLLQRWEELLKLDEDSASLCPRDPWWSFTVAKDCMGVAKKLAQAGRRGDARAMVIRGLATAQPLANSRDATPFDWTEYAEILLTCPEKDLCDIQAAIGYLQRAAANSSVASEETLRALTAAYYLNGSYAQAVRTAAELSPLLPHLPNGTIAAIHCDPRVLADDFRH